MNENNGISVEYKRRAVYSGLKQFLIHDELMQAMLTWQENYSDKPKFAIAQFINYLVNNHDLKNKRQKVQVSLARFLMSPIESLEADPISLMEAHLDNQPVKKKTVTKVVLTERGESDNNLMFRLFIAEIEIQLIKLDSALALQMLESFKGRVLRLEIGLNDKKCILKWLNQRNEKLLIHIKKSQLHLLINEVYIFLCERFGPIEADQLFGQIIHNIEQSEQAKGLSPRSLL